jgi:hypothetical protein
MGFAIDLLTYHDKLSLEIYDILSKNYSITSLIIRTRSYRIVAHTHIQDLVFLKEEKAMILYGIPLEEHMK